MFGLMGGLGTGPAWELLPSWMSPMHALGALILGLLLTLHITIVRAVIRPIDGLGSVPHEPPQARSRDSQGAPRRGPCGRPGPGVGVRSPSVSRPHHGSPPFHQHA